MADEATLTLTLDPDLLDRFVSEAEMAMRPVDDVLRDLVRGFVDRRHAERDAEIDAALREADDIATKRIPHKEAIARLSRQRDELARRAQPSRG